MQEGLQFFLLPGRGKILESHGGFEGRQIVAADGEDETVGGFHGKATPLGGKNSLDMVFIDQGCTVDAQKDRWIQTLFQLLQRRFDGVFETAGIDKNKAILHPDTGNIEGADNQIFEIILDGKPRRVVLAGAEKFD